MYIIYVYFYDIYIIYISLLQTSTDHCVTLVAVSLPFALNVLIINIFLIIFLNVKKNNINPYP